MNGVSVGYDENAPPSTDSLGGLAPHIQSVKTNLRGGLDSEHDWPSTTGTHGAHRMGSAKAFFAAQSYVSSSDTNGRLFLASDTSRLFGVGSGGTVLLGAPTLLSMGTSTAQRSQWVIETGTASTRSSDGTTQITIPNSGYSGIPYLQITASRMTQGTFGLSTNTVTATTFFVHSKLSTPASLTLNCDFHWMSLGTRQL